MRVTESPLPGVKRIEPEVFGDARGWFLESYNAGRYAAHGIADLFVQDNLSRSAANVLRGLHYTVAHPQAQIVFVSRGIIFDVVVDLRRFSPTFGRWAGFTLDGRHPAQIYMPAGCAHGFCVLSEDGAEIQYKCSQPYRAGDEGGVAWNDPDLAIAWPLAAPVLKPRDAAFPRLAEIAADRLPQAEFSP